MDACWRKQKKSFSFFVFFLSSMLRPLLLSLKIGSMLGGDGSDMQNGPSITKVACKMRCQHVKLIDV